MAVGREHLGRSRGMVLLPAQGSVADAWTRLEAAVAERGLTVFARIDFAADAAAVGCTFARRDCWCSAIRAPALRCWQRRPPRDRPAAEAADLGRRAGRVGWATTARLGRRAARGAGGIARRLQPVAELAAIAAATVR